ncbi:unknown protein [Waddlia chondrophila 2032/99]|uniref:Uncharacterized protein n=1 Tax=Waddlia chondrophila 2032/99 TaxID=765953 RepID=F8LDG7_9BACT|nr:unknown protein [Waddlia chondrophila 2032/99]
MILIFMNAGMDLKIYKDLQKKVKFYLTIFLLNKFI